MVKMWTQLVKLYQGIKLFISQMLPEFSRSIHPKIQLKYPSGMLNLIGIEANNMQIRNGHVTAQALKSVGRKGSTGFDKKGMWEWLMVSTTGIFLNSA